MKKMISCCGLNCANCDALKATIRNDDILRKEIAEKWKVMYNAANLTYLMINCMGCREEGAKFNHCLDCEIRKCVKSKDFNTCSDCQELEKCSIVSFIHKQVPEALDNLRNLN